MAAQEGSKVAGLPLLLALLPLWSLPCPQVLPLHPLPPFVTCCRLLPPTAAFRHLLPPSAAFRRLLPPAAACWLQAAVCRAAGW